MSSFTKATGDECNERTFGDAEIGAAWGVGIFILGPLNLRIDLIAYDTQVVDHCLLLNTEQG
jgi:hypothetical protein